MAPRSTLLKYSWSVVVAVAFLCGGCGQMPPSPRENPAEKERVDPKHLALVTVRYEPKGMSGPPLHGYGEGAVGGAAGGAGGAVLGTLYGMTMLGPVAIIMLPVALPIGMIAGTAMGASSGTSEEAIEHSRQVWSKAVKDLRLQQNLQNQLLAELQREKVGEQIRVPKDIGPASPDELVRYDPALADVVLEAGIQEIKFWQFANKAKEAAYGLRLVVRAKIIDTKKQSVIDQIEFGFSPGSHTSEEWLKDNAAMLDRSIDEGLKEIASDIVREFFRLYYPSREREPGESHESGAPFYVLRPVYPVGTRSIFKHEIAAVDSLQPTLRWEAFPRAFDGISKNGSTSSFSDVNYEIQIHRVSRRPLDGGFMQPKFYYETGPVFLQGAGLSQPEYTVEQLLEPCGYYSWSVRARFLMDGHPRITEWSGWYHYLYQPWYARRTDQGFWAKTNGFKFRAPSASAGETCPD